MNLDWEITGEAKGVNSNNVFSVELFLNDRSVGFLNMNLETERVDNSLFDFFDKPCPHTRDFSHELGHA